MPWTMNDMCGVRSASKLHGCKSGLARDDLEAHNDHEYVMKELSNPHQERPRPLEECGVPLVSVTEIATDQGFADSAEEVLRLQDHGSKPNVPTLEDLAALAVADVHAAHRKAAFTQQLALLHDQRRLVLLDHVAVQAKLHGRSPIRATRSVK